VSKTSTPPVPASGIRDNHTRGTVGDFLQDKIQPGADLSVVSAYFTINAHHAMQAQLGGIGSMRFLFGEPTFLSALDPDRTDAKAFGIQEAGLALANTLRQRAMARACADWIEAKAQVRSIIKPGFLHGKLYHIQNGPVSDAILGSSNFTVAGLGLSPRPNLELNLELNLEVDSNRDRADLLRWFDDLWADENLTEDVKGAVLKYLGQIYSSHSPRLVYFKTLFHVFEAFLGQSQSQAREAERHLFDTQIWDALFEFQKHGVSGLVNRIGCHGGAILADAVGLGKTFQALAVIKYFESQNKRALVLCPKKLRDNWTVYQGHAGSQLNPFPRDRFGYTVLSHTDLSRDKGQAGDVDLSHFNWSAYDLVVLDESHNFRNNARGRRDADGQVVTRTRYERLMDDIIRAGGRTQVLLLSATPVNNDLKDLRNQIYLLTGDEDAAFATSMGIASVRETLASAQRTFTEWSKGASQEAASNVNGSANNSANNAGRNASSLMEKLPAAFFKLMDELTIARSRRHITRHYAHSLEEIGAFPKRLPPIPVFPAIDTRGEFLSYDAINDQISAYTLALFTPFNNVRDEFKPLYEEQAVQNFSQERREHFLVGMMKVNFLKRLESSVSSFAITLRRTLDKIEALEANIAAFESQQLASVVDASTKVDEGEEDLADAFAVGARGYDLRHLDLKKWKEELKEDWGKLHSLWESARDVTPQRDSKLADLKRIIAEKATQPPIDLDGVPNRKVLVFTAFADTAKYLHENLAAWAKQELGLESALVVGGSASATWGKSEYSSVLVNFSPRSKRRAQLQNWPQDREIDLLIATDCISEGQNLQDCDLVVNYDIHWNPVRLIQRFGRVDRIGSRSREVQLVNFWPTPDLNRYINLKNRVEARMALVDAAATTEDNLLSGAGDSERPVEELIQDDLRYRDKQLLRLKDEVIDLEEMNEGVSLDEFSLDDFRQELLSYLDAQKRELAAAPLGIYAVVEPSPDFPQLSPGVLWCLRRKATDPGTSGPADADDPGAKVARVNPLEPFFLVYIRDDGSVRYSFAQAKQVLEAWRVLSAEHAKPHQALCDLFDAETQDGRDMSRYDALLSQSVKAIQAAFQKRNEAQIGRGAGRGGVLAGAAQSISSQSDFELVTWLVIKRAAST